MSVYMTEKVGRNIDFFSRLLLPCSFARGPCGDQDPPRGHALYKDGIKEPQNGRSSSQHSRNMSADQSRAARPGWVSSLYMRVWRTSVLEQRGSMQNSMKNAEHQALHTWSRYHIDWYLAASACHRYHTCCTRCTIYILSLNSPAGLIRPQRVCSSKIKNHSSKCSRPDTHRCTLS